MLVRGRIFTFNIASFIYCRQLLANYLICSRCLQMYTPYYTKGANSWAVSVRFKWLTASVSTCPFQMQPAIFQMELTASARQSRAVAVWTEVKERSAVTRDGNSQDQLRLSKSKVTLVLTCQFWSCREVGSALKDGRVQPAHEVRRVLIIHTAETMDLYLCKSMAETAQSCISAVEENAWILIASLSL